jgi:hypothetical protein
MHAETEAAKAARIPKSPGPSHDDGVAPGVAEGAEERPLSPLAGSAISRMTVGDRFIFGASCSSTERVSRVRTAPVLRLRTVELLPLSMHRGARRSRARVPKSACRSWAPAAGKAGGQRRDRYGRSASEAGPRPGVIRIGHWLERNGTTGGSEALSPSLALSAAIATRASPPISS